ncbi:MAG: putative acyl-CoA dehydrogenase [Solirubrobacterales bacterium]|nr:putative acyl-CoA dehydrogenase [Solirubrobacterales bacterium]
MSSTIDPRTARAQSTHEVTNQAPPLEGHNAFDADPALSEALEREGGGWGLDRARDLGGLVASAEAQEHSRRATRNLPRLISHDRFGNRVDRVEYDPSWHWMLRAGIERELSSLPWREERPGSHVVRAALFYLMSGLDPSPCCPISVNYAAIPTLRQEPGLAAEWAERVSIPDYDRYAQAGMAMTEKQGGSDLRANTTRAEPEGDGSYAITGHKWFCTIVNCDFFFTLAQAPGGLSCFLMEKGPGFRVMRLKDKLGGRAIASSEVEFEGVRAWLIGEEGRGVPTLASTQVNFTRLDALLGTAGTMRRALAEAVHHTRHRSAFGRRLAEQPLMRNVLCDLAVESEAAMALALRCARAFDESEPPASSEQAKALRRVATAIGKYWVCKRGAAMAAEALECLGGNGYIEEAPMARIYRDIELNTVWEGAGNVAALDVLRAVVKEPAGLPALLAECELAAGADRRFDAHLRAVNQQLAGLEDAEAQWSARRLVEDLALALQASLLLRNSPPAVADAFCAGRLDGHGHAFGTLPAGIDAEPILERALAL